MAITLRPYQAEAKDAILQEWAEGRKRTLLVLPTGCHAVGQRLMMADGSFQAVENIQVGDLLMGPDGTPRTVLHRTEGEGAYYRVMPVKGDPFVVTGDHKLTLVRTSEARNPRFPSEKHGGELIDVTVAEWLTWSKNRKHLYKLIVLFQFGSRLFYVKADVGFGDDGGDGLHVLSSLISKRVCPLSSTHALSRFGSAG